MLALLYSYWWSGYDKELEQITKQRRLRHELHRQIVFSKIRLKPTITIYKSGFHELDKKSIEKAYMIPVPTDKNKKRRLK